MSLSLERTFDYRKVKKYLDDPVISSKVIYLVSDNGLWVLHEHEDGLQIHACLSEQCRGSAAIRSARQAFMWVADNTPYNKIYAVIPKEVRPACFVAAWAGMVFQYEQSGMRIYEWAA